MSKPSKKKPFRVVEAPKLKQAIEESAKKVAKRMIENEDDYINREEWEAIAKLEEDERKLHYEKYPPNPPNHLCYHALIDGILIDNAFSPKVHELNLLMVMPLEKVYIWTAKKDEYSYLVSEVSEEVHIRNVWRTFGNVFKFTAALFSGFESIPEPDYQWIYRFNPDIEWKETEFIDGEHFRGGVVQKLEFFNEAAPLIEMLINNDILFYSVQNMVAGVESHWFCLYCAYEKEENRRHKNHEPHIWEYSLLIPKLEMAIVKSTKAVEGILGQQGGSEEKARARWSANVDIDPDSKFMDTGHSYFTYHGYLINEVRNKVAHNLRTKPFKVSRQMTIDSQVYAYEIIKSYYEKFRKSKEEAHKILQINEELLKRDRKDYGTCMTQ